MQFITLTNRFDERLTVFRRKLYAEFDVSADLLETEMSLAQVRATFPELPTAAVEEIYKYGLQKWSRTEFHRIEAAVDDEGVFSISGSREYGRGLLRVAMHHYTLQSHRRTHRSLFFRDGGFLSRHIRSSIEEAGSRFLFFSVYPHNDRLRTLVKNMLGRRTSHEGLPMAHLKDFRPLGEPVLLHGVPQHLFVFDPLGREDWRDEFVSRWHQDSPSPQVMT